MKPARTSPAPHGAWGDQGDGTYRNSILPGDYSDLDAIRVDDDFYAISSTFQFSPGIVVLHSKDLVSWWILGHVVADLTQIGPSLNWDVMDPADEGSGRRRCDARSRPPLCTRAGIDRAPGRRHVRRCEPGAGHQSPAVIRDLHGTVARFIAPVPAAVMPERRRSCSSSAVHRLTLPIPAPVFGP